MTRYFFKDDHVDDDGVFKMFASGTPPLLPAAYVARRMRKAVPTAALLVFVHLSSYTTLHTLSYGLENTITPHTIIKSYH
jgi:hypothetical protein